MKRFEDIKGLTLPTIRFVGKKIPTRELLNKEITIYHYDLTDSKFNSKKCLTMQIEFNNEKRVVFTSAGWLIKIVPQIKTDDFPFIATIIKDNKYYQFKKSN